MKKILWFILFAVQLSCSSDEDDKLRFLKKGNVAFQDNNTKDAIRYYEEALKIDSAYADAFYNKGLALASLNKYDEAIDAYTNAVNVSPEYGSALFARATSHYMVKQYFAAQQDVASVRVYWQDSSKADFLEGLINTALEKYPQALLNFERAQQLDPENQEITVNIGNTLYNLGSFNKAKNTLGQSFDSDHEQSVAYNTLGLIALDEDLPARANFFVDSALVLNPSEPYFLNNKGRVMQQLGLIEEARSYYDQSMIIDPYNPWVYYNKGELLFLVKDYGQALRLMQRADKLLTHPEIKIGLAEAYAFTGDSDNACLILRNLPQEEAAIMMLELKCD
jgi:tetratricopeptide (TPR) repeat protein